MSLTDKEIEMYSGTKNRLGYTSFISDHQKISDDYEKFLSVDDDSWIDGMDHYFIATTIELGIRKEVEILKLKKRIEELELKKEKK